MFARCGWTQEQLAQKEGKTQAHVGKVLRFGRFLTFSSVELNAEFVPTNLTEFRFRQYWERTDKTEINEPVRFLNFIAAEINSENRPATCNSGGF